MIVFRLVVVSVTEINLYQTDVNTLSKTINHYWKKKKKLKSLYSSDHTILFKFYQHVVQILIK